MSMVVSPPVSGGEGSGKSCRDGSPVGMQSAGVNWWEHEQKRVNAGRGVLKLPRGGPRRKKLKTLPKPPACPGGER